MFKVVNKDYFGQLVEIKLKELVPDIECEGRDFIMYDIACNDLRYYLMLKWKFTTFNFGDFNRIFTECIIKGGKSVKIFIDNFLNNWYIKWKQRVKILPNNEQPKVNADRFLVSILSNIPQRVLNGMDTYLLPLVECLFKHGEYACTEQIADRALSFTLNKIKRKPRTVDEEVRLLQSVMSSMVNEVENYDGPLIYFKLNSNYFNKDLNI